MPLPARSRPPRRSARALCIALAVAAAACSPPMPPSAPLERKDDGEDALWVDSFDDAPLGAIPPGWGGRSEEAARVYAVAEEDGERYLQARSGATAEFVLRPTPVDLTEYPWLNWRWRPRRFPPGGDESVRERADVVASVNVVIVASMAPKTIKYSWSTTLPRGTITTSPFSVWPSQVDVVVMRSGPPPADARGRWVSERRNVLEDYRRFYDVDDDEVLDEVRIEAIVLMSDADSTGTVAEADYDQIFFSRR